MASRNNKPARIVKGTAKQPTLKEASGIWTLDEALQAHRANAWPQPNLFQPVSNSLRLDASRNTFLSKAISRSGNQRTWTWSGWFKPSKVSNAQYLFVSTNTNGNPFTYLYFSESNFIWWDGTQRLVTTAKYRDTSAWYHVVLAVDTTQATAANRGKLYINGVQVTSFSVANYLAQGAATYTNSNASGENIVYIGAAPQYVTGYLGEVNFVDGYQLDPSLLGKFDTNNTWVPIPYTGSYGTNGFYLPFTNATTSQTLGYDASLTGTTTYDADQDPYRGHVALHLTGNGPASGNNNAFADSGPNNYAVTRNGVVTQGSFSPFPFNTNTPYNPAVHGASMYQAAVDSDFPSFPTGSQGSNFTFAGDFTIEGWLYYNSSSGDTSFYVISDGTNYLAFNISMSAGVFNIYLNSGSPTSSPAHGMTINTWNHVAMVRSGSTVTLYANGVSKGTISNSSTLGFTSPTINRCGGGVGGVTRYMSSFRIVKAAIYTAAFTPTNQPFGSLTNNLVQFSEDIANSAWSMAGSTVISGAGIAPDGTPSACLVVPNTSSQQHYFNGVHYASTGSTTTLSFYAKASGYGYIQAETPIDGGGYSSNTYDLITGTVVGSQWDSGSLGSATITSAGNGWWRCTLQNTNMSASGNNFYFGIRPTGNTGTSSYAGDGVSGIYVWGVQLEVSSTATTYTPTPANFRTAPALLLNFANAAVVDSAGANNLLTGGSATISGASKYGSGAMSFASDGYLSFAPGSQYAFGTGDFTIEAWVNTTTNSTDGFYRRIYMTDGPTGNASGNIQLAIAPTTGYVNLWDGGSLDMLSTTNISTGAWFHIAATRVGTTLRLFVNGRQEAISSYNTSIVPNSGNPRPWVGAYTSSSGRWNGQIDDLRVTKGVARYTSDFAPPARALPEVGGKSFVTTNVTAGVVKRFTTTGSTSWTAPVDVTSVEVLVVAGGGGGGGDQAGGGGGAGGVIYNNQYAVIPGQTYTVVVGGGGAGDGTRGTSSSNYFFGATGGNSQFGNLIALGGGGGASMVVNTSPYTESRAAGRPGGSGGGASNWQSTTTGAGGAGTAGQGFNGGSSTVASGNGHIGGGGGGAGAAGGNATNPDPGAGGAGLSFGILGTPYYFAGGGGGGCYYVTAGVGGIGGGGGGASNSSTSSAGGGSALNSGATGVTGTVGGAGGANTGGGGGGAGGTGGAGGSGIVVVRYTTTAVGNSSDATTDNLVDSPTQYGHDYGNGGEVVGNYATLNPLVLTDGATLSNGNLNILGSTAYRTTPATIAMTSGKWYWENRLVTFNPSTDIHLGVCLGNFTSFQGTWVLSTAFGWGYTCQGGYGYTNNTLKNISSSVRAAGDTIGLAFDADAGNLYAYVNGAVVNGGSPIYTSLTSGPYFPFVTSGDSTGSVACNFGQRAWAYAPPAGYNALTTKNFARPTGAAAVPNQYFDTVLYTGTGAAQTITLPGAFQPDLVWMKARSAADNHVLMDSVRGTSAALFSDLTNAEVTNATRITSFNSNGFTLGSSASVNTSSATYVAWGWKAGGTAVSNTSGTIASQVSANTTSGFSIVTYTGTGVNATVGHGLGVAPSMYICKRRDSTSPWRVYHTSLSYTTYINLSDAGASASDSSVWNSAPTTSVFGIGTNDMNTNTGTYVAYCWAEVAGFSKFGSYAGNSATDGPFVYLGFRPRWVMIRKTTDTGGHWVIFDSSRNTFNLTQGGLLASSNVTEYTSGQAGAVDLLSNGFKLKNADGFVNASGSTYIYMAFAEAPFGNVNGTAR